MSHYHIPAAPESANTLAGLADCALPDDSASPGATYLTTVRDALAETVDSAHDIADPSDLASHIADECVPVYTHAMWRTFVDLCAYNQDISGLCGPSDDMEQRAKVALFLCAEQLCMALLKSWECDGDREGT